MGMTLGYLLRGSALNPSTLPCHWQQPMVYAYMVCILLFVVATKVGIRNPVNVTCCSMFLKLLVVFIEPCPCSLLVFTWNGKTGGGDNTLPRIIVFPDFFTLHTKCSLDFLVQFGFWDVKNACSNVCSWQLEVLPYCGDPKMWAHFCLVWWTESWRLLKWLASIVVRPNSGCHCLTLLTLK